VNDSTLTKNFCQTQKKIASKGVLRAQITFSNIMEFVSRHYAVFSACAKISGVLKAQFTFSRIAEFVNQPLTMALTV